MKVYSKTTPFSGVVLVIWRGGGCNAHRPSRVTLASLPWSVFPLAVCSGTRKPGALPVALYGRLFEFCQACSVARAAGTLKRMHYTPPTRKIY